MSVVLDDYQKVSGTDGITIMLVAPGPSVPLECPHCHTVLGQIVEHDNRLWLRMGDWLVAHSMLPACPGRAGVMCGKTVHFHRPSKAFEKLMARYEGRTNGRH